MERLFASLFKGRGIFFAFLEVGRPWNGTIAWLFSVLGASLVLGTPPTLATIFIMFIVTLLVYMGGSSLNDAFDTDVDSINMPYRPIERGDLTVKNVIYFSLALYLIALVFSAFQSFLYFLTAIFMIITTLIYSSPPLSLKNRGILGNFGLAVGTVFATSYSGAVLVTNNPFVKLNFLVPIISLTMFFTFFCIMKEFKDYKGDNVGKKKTLVITHGIKKASFLNITGTFTFFLISVMTFYYMFKSTLLVFLSTIVLLFLLFFEIIIYKKQEKKLAENAWAFGRFTILLFLLLLLFQFL